ncbi:MAG: aminotransferase class I/II-fold pyridoxal phosphate-dependent enzyme [Clostridiales bacterium]|nr:aminotransferase class I/II-fold pyridoxal phosphate-dependent enzyme [Clostridiales bacterium]
MRNFVNKRAGNLKPSGIRKFFDIVSEMQDAISLGVGEPDFITPWGIRDTAIRSIKRGLTQYTGNRGLPELRENICKYLKCRFGVEYSPENTLVTVGASEAIDLCLRAICEIGDEILVPEPCYVSYAPSVVLAGGTPVTVNCIADNDFILTPEQIEEKITEKTKAIIVAYPNNPTGAIMTKEQLEAIIPVIKKHDLLVISDEIYAELTYIGKHVSIASLGDMAERTVLINGFSKAFAMTGWRIGFVCAPPEIDDAMFKIHQYSIMCAPRVSQHAANGALVEGLSDDFSVVEEMREEYNRRGRFLVNAFNSLGLKCFQPKGAFYVFPCVESTGLDGEEFANRLLMAEKVAVVPGSAFGEAGKWHVRCSYATSMAKLTEAIARITRFVNSLKNE